MFTLDQLLDLTAFNPNPDYSPADTASELYWHVVPQPVRDQAAAILQGLAASPQHHVTYVGLDAPPYQFTLISHPKRHPHDLRFRLVRRLSPNVPEPHLWKLVIGLPQDNAPVDYQTHVLPAGHDTTFPA